MVITNAENDEHSEVNTLLEVSPAKTPKKLKKEKTKVEFKKEEITV